MKLLNLKTLLNNQFIKNVALLLYLCVGMPYAIYIIYTQQFLTLVNSSGHLEWNFPINRAIYCIWLFSLLFSFLYEQKWQHLLFAIITFSIFIYKNLVTAGSLWCWFINSVSIYLAVHLLFYLPFYEHKEIC